GDLVRVCREAGWRNHQKDCSHKMSGEKAWTDESHDWPRSWRVAERRFPVCPEKQVIGAAAVCQKRTAWLCGLACRLRLLERCFRLEICCGRKLAAPRFERCHMFKRLAGHPVPIATVSIAGMAAVGIAVAFLGSLFPSMKSSIWEW